METTVANLQIKNVDQMLTQYVLRVLIFICIIQSIDNPSKRNHKTANFSYHT